MTKKIYIREKVLKHKFVFLGVFMNTTIMTLLYLIFPFLNGKIVNVAFYERDMKIFMNECLIYIGILFFHQFIIGTINNLLLSHIMTGFLFDIKQDMFKKILYGKGKWLSKLHSGDMIRRMNEDAVGFVDFIYWGILWGYSNILQIIISAVFMFYYNIYLGIATIIMVPIVYYSSEIYKKKIQEISKKMLAAKGMRVSFLFEIINNIREIKALNATRTVISKYALKTTVINRMEVESDKMCVISERINSLTSLLAKLFIFIICAILIAARQMKIGGFISAINYFEMSLLYFSAINEKIVNIGKSVVSIQRVIDVLNMPEEYYKENLISDWVSNGEIVFKNVYFGFDNSKYILKDANFFIQGGSMVGIVGKSGSGKTTIANLLCSFDNVNSGKIVIDGMEIEKYNLHDYRRQIGIVSQDVKVYNESLRYNLSFSNEKDNDGLIMDIIRQVALLDFYESLSAGLDTNVGEEGHNLSGGQKQRLAIARLLIKNPKIMIFDEATAALDDLNEEVISGLIKKMSRKHTIIVIAHKFLTIQNCDKIICLNNGRIVESDTPEKLLRTNSIFRKLFEKQYHISEVNKHDKVGGI